MKSVCDCACFTQLRDKIVAQLLQNLIGYLTSVCRSQAQCRPVGGSPQVYRNHEDQEVETSCSETCVASIYTVVFQKQSIAERRVHTV